jgi:hypothetical protein
LFSLLPMWFGQGTSPVFSMQQIFLTSSTVPFCTQKTKRKKISCVSSPIMFPISILYQIIESISGISIEFRCCCWWRWCSHTNLCLNLQAFKGQTGERDTHTHGGRERERERGGGGGGGGD